MMLLSCLLPFLGRQDIQTPLLPCFRQETSTMHVVMRDRSKNRKPLQKGRNLSIEAIQAVQLLKRAKATEDSNAVEHIMQMKVRRLIKFDLMAVLGELQRQSEGSLAFQVFEEMRGEHWYRPHLSIYADMVRVLANNNLLEKVGILTSYMKMESFKDDTLGLNALLENLLVSGFSHIAMDCYAMMKLWETEPDKSTFEILISGLESNGEYSLSMIVREDAKNYFGGYLGFLEKSNGK